MTDSAASIVEYYEKAEKYKNAGDIISAIQTYSNGIRYFKNDAEIHWRLGDVFCQIGRFDEGIKECIKSIGLNNTQWEPYQVLGQAYDQQARLHEAESAYREAIRLSKGIYVTSLLLLGGVLHRKGETDAAVSAYRESLRLAPINEEGRIHYYLGKALMDLPNARQLTT